MADILPSIDRCLDLLVGAFDRARRYQTGMAAFVIYQAENVRAAFEEALVDRLQAVAQCVRRLRFKPNAPPELRTVWRPLLITPPADNESIFVYGLQHAFPELLNSLNYRRELIPDHRWRLLFWALDDEATRVMRDAPDFWAFVNQVLDLPEAPLPEECVQLIEPSVWSRFGDSEIQNLAPAERRARIALRERLLNELPDSEDAQAARADLHYALAGLYGIERQLSEAERHAQAALALAEQLNNAMLGAQASRVLTIIDQTRI